MTIPNIATFDHGTLGEVIQFDIFADGLVQPPTRKDASGTSARRDFSSLLYKKHVNMATMCLFVYNIPPNCQG